MKVIVGLFGLHNFHDGDINSYIEISFSKIFRLQGFSKFNEFMKCVGSVGGGNRTCFTKIPVIIWYLLTIV